jgi:hypothetical protein
MEKDVEAGHPSRILHFQRVLHQGAVNDNIVNHLYEGSGTSDDPFVVTWLDDDPVNPMNYPMALKWAITMAVAVATLAVAFVSSAYSGGIAEILQEFHVAQIIGTLGISLFVLGFALGPLLWAPLSGKSTRSVKPQVRTAKTLQNCTAGNTSSSAPICCSLSSTLVQRAQITSRL